MPNIFKDFFSSFLKKCGISIKFAIPSHKKKVEVEANTKVKNNSLFLTQYKMIKTIAGKVKTNFKIDKTLLIFDS